MPFSINIRSDNDSSKPIRSLWRECALLEEPPSMEVLGYPPHLSLAVYDDIDETILFNAFDTAFTELAKVTVRFERLSYFDAGDRVILWADPILPSVIAEIHNHIHQLIDADLCRPNYRPGAWVPHCSLAIAIDSNRRNAAIALSKRLISPIEVEFDVADCASFFPVEVVREKPLYKYA